MSEQEKIMIASDIHGSAHWCEKLVAACEREKPEKLLLLGDLLYHGPRNELPDGYAPKKVAELLNPLGEKILCVRGNCDAEVDQMMLEFPILADYCILSAGARMIFATHGHHYNETHLPLLQPGDVLLHGHTHIPGLEKRDNYIYANPGSVTLPKQNSPRSYLLLEDKVLTLKDLAQNVAAKVIIQ